MEPLELCRDILAKAKALGAEESAVVVSRSTEVSLVRRAGKLEQATQASSLGASLSLLVNDRYSVHSTSDLRPAALDAFLERAIAATRVLEPEPERRQPPAELCGRYTSEAVLDRFDPGWESLTAEQRRDQAERLEACVDALPTRDQVLSATMYVGDSIGETARVLSNGFENVSRGTGYGHGAEMTLLEPGGRRPEGSSYFSATHLADLPPPEHIAAECWKRAEQRLASGPAPSGRYPMLLQNSSVGRILGVLGGPLSGSELHQGRSFLAGKKGERIAASGLTILDDPTIPRGLGSRPFDGDCLYARPFSVIEAGVLQNYYINVYYGRKLGMEPTTGGRSNWVVTPGARSVDAITKDLDRCIVVTGFLGGNSNGLTGDFSFGVQGLLLEHGEVVKHLSEMNVSGNIGELLMNFGEAADDVWKWSGVRTPSLLFEGVQFSGT
ncbi:MAG: TldD/PmbA family protein [Pseudomonadota bacterium]|nr:TldD/PmbA family protein [Pseudomonadota bacterium]